jgi:hypothetical protein
LAAADEIGRESMLAGIGAVFAGDMVLLKPGLGGGGTGVEDFGGAPNDDGGGGPDA